MWISFVLSLVLVAVTLLTFWRRKSQSLPLIQTESRTDIG